MTTVNLSRAVWRTSRRSQQNGACVELAPLHEVMAVRDSKDPAGPFLAIPASQWATLLRTIKTGAHDL